MIARSVGVIGVRIIALLVLLRGLFSAITVGSVILRGAATPSTATTVLATSSNRVPDAALVEAVAWSTLPSVALHIGVALLLLLLSRPLGKLLARGID